MIRYNCGASTILRHPPRTTYSYVAIFNRPELECITWAVSVRHSFLLVQIFARRLLIGQLRQHEPRWRRGNVREIDLLAREAIAGPVPPGLFMNTLIHIRALKFPTRWKNKKKHKITCQLLQVLIGHGAQWSVLREHICFTAEVVQCTHTPSHTNTGWGLKSQQAQRWVVTWGDIPAPHHTKTPY